MFWPIFEFPHEMNVSVFDRKQIKIESQRIIPFSKGNIVLVPPLPYNEN